MTTNMQEAIFSDIKIIFVKKWNREKTCMKWDDGFVGYENLVYTLYSASIYYFSKTRGVIQDGTKLMKSFVGYIISYLTKMVDAKCDEDGVLNW